MTAYYNEIEPYAAKWLKNLIAAGHIAAGEVDTRSIEDVRAYDLKGFTQCHFFAGIGGWSLALRLAGWDDSRPVWTGSCPCQPFSVGGTGGAMADERHLWPKWFELIKGCNPSVIFGEQVANAIAHGWLDLVCDDLESSGYSIGAFVVPALSVQSPQLRNRLWFVADPNHKGLEGRIGTECESVWQDGQTTSRSTHNPWAGAVLAECRDGKRRRVEPSICPVVDGVSERMVRLRAYGNAIVPQVAAEVIGAFMECRP